MSLPQPDSVVTFGKRRGYVVGYVTLKRHGHLEEVRTFSIVDLDPESCSYLEPKQGEANHDCFISMMIIHPDNFDEVVNPGVSNTETSS